ncbi:MAG: ABC transporter permease subunit, partial [Zetaproteobacteria bacterium]|nr:ABC transporter permease subunit [Zetaproteobacteria bacterium]
MSKNSMVSKRNIFVQSCVFILFALFAFSLFENTAANLRRQGIASGFEFLQSQAGFSIVQSLIPYGPEHSYGRAFLVGLVNTFLVSTFGIWMATCLGFVLGIASVAHIWTLRKLASLYVELLRNIPLLLQIFIWYFVILRSLPSPRESHAVFESIYLNNRGLYIPAFDWEEWSWSLPVLSGFNFEGGWVFIPEFMALLAALSMYTAAFIAEIVRAGLLAVDKGQREASASLGL